MTQDEIIEMARQAGVRDDEHTFEFSQYKYLERFAKLVAEKEREACAKLLEKTDLGGLKDNLAMQSWVAEMLLAYAKAIRARGQAC